jgi:DNA-binding MarR family transcriptional regulator
MTAIGQLEEAQASLRLLIILYQAKRPLTQSELFDEIRSKYKLGRYTMNTAIETCLKLGLITRESKKLKKNPMPSLFHALTPKGRKIAELALQMDAILSS